MAVLSVKNRRKNVIFPMVSDGKVQIMDRSRAIAARCIYAATNLIFGDMQISCAAVSAAHNTV